MPKPRPIALSIAGFDPSAGAGILADIKTFESCSVYGLGVCSALTVQNDVDFKSVNWVSEKEIIAQINVLLERFDVDFVKIGIIENWSILTEIIFHLKDYNEQIQIVLDPVLRSSTGFDLQKKIDFMQLGAVLQNITLLTPNWQEVEQLAKQSAKTAVQMLSTMCPILLKGGHRKDALGKDELWNHGILKSTYEAKQIAKSGKHGSGCVLSSAITAYLAQGYKLMTACKKGKQYTEQFLNSNDTLLGYHFTN